MSPNDKFCCHSPDDKRGNYHFNFIDFYEHELPKPVEISFASTVVKRIQANVLSMLLVHVLPSCVCVSLTTDIILPCQRQDCHKATRLAVCPGLLAEGLMEVFMHVSQLAGNNLHVTSGPRRRPTCWAAPWRSSPPPSSSTRPRAPCPEPAPFARLLTKMAQQMQVLHTAHLPAESRLYIPEPPSLPPPLFLFVTLFPQTHTDRRTHTHICLCSSPEGNCMLWRK